LARDAPCALSAVADSLLKYSLHARCHKNVILQFEHRCRYPINQMPPSSGIDPAAVASALKFFAWAYQDGGKMAADLDYVPLPAALIAQVKKTWATGITANGKPIWSEK
jgi:hypothetical protein